MTTKLNTTITGIRGTVAICPIDPPKPCGKYVYQRVQPGKGNVAADPSKALQLRRYVIPFDPRTPAQIARRARLAAGVATWHALSAEQKKAWSAEGKRRQIGAYCAFLSAFLRA